jgi:hypothetical protein
MEYSNTGGANDWHDFVVAGTTYAGTAVTVYQKDPIIDADMLDYIGSGGATHDTEFSFCAVADVGACIDTSGRLYVYFMTVMDTILIIDKPPPGSSYVDIYPDTILIMAIWSDNGLEWDSTNIVRWYESPHYDSLKECATCYRPMSPRAWVDSNATYKLMAFWNRMYADTAKDNVFLLWESNSLESSFTFVDTSIWADANDHIGIHPHHGWFGRRGHQYDAFVYFADSGVGNGYSNRDSSGIYYGVSNDCITWDFYSVPVLKARDTGHGYWDDGHLYACAAIWDAYQNNYMLWYAGVRDTTGKTVTDSGYYMWHTGQTRVRFDYEGGKHFVFNLADPDGLYAIDHEWSIKPCTEKDINITRIDVSCNADPTTELDFDLKFADAFIGLANAAVIDELNTTAGVTTITKNFDSTEVPAGKCLYILFNAEPDAGITQINIDITHDLNED